MITSGKYLTCLCCRIYICNCCKVTPLYTAILIVQFAFLLKDNGSKWTELWEYYICKSSRNLKEQYSSLHYCKNKHFRWVDFRADVFLCVCTKPPVSLALGVQQDFTFLPTCSRSERSHRSPLVVPPFAQSVPRAARWVALSQHSQRSAPWEILRRLLKQL